MTEAELIWASEWHPDWDAKAAATATVALLPDEEKPTRVRVMGPCPRCNHLTSQVVPLEVLSVVEALPPVLRALRRKRPREAVVEVLCDCSEQHPGAPKEGTGCGLSWRLSLGW